MLAEPGTSPQGHRALRLQALVLLLGWLPFGTCILFDWPRPSIAFGFLGGGLVLALVVTVVFAWRHADARQPLVERMIVVILAPAMAAVVVLPQVHSAGSLPARRNVALAAKRALADARDAESEPDRFALAEYTGSLNQALEVAGEMGPDWLPRLLDDEDRRLVGRIAERGVKFLLARSDDEPRSRCGARVLGCARALGRRDLGARLLEDQEQAMEIAERRPSELIAWSAWMPSHPSLRAIAARALRSERRSEPSFAAAIAWSRCRRSRAD